jgi:hypothetical protein
MMMMTTSEGAEPSNPCYVNINDIRDIQLQVIENVCSTTIYSVDYPFPVVLRSYPPGAAIMVESSIADDPGNTFADNLFFTSSFVFGYLTGDNTKKENLTRALTAPFILRPVSPERVGDLNWVGAMALAPSLWPATSFPPSPTSDAELKPFGDLVMASVPVILSSSPTEEDFRKAYQQLEELVSLLNVPGQWVINTTSQLTPSFNFYFTNGYNGTNWQIEASAEVYYRPPFSNNEDM